MNYRHSTKADVTVVQKNHSIRNENITYYRYDTRAWWQTQGKSRIRLLNQLKTLKVWEMGNDKRLLKDFHTSNLLYR